MQRLSIVILAVLAVNASLLSAATPAEKVAKQTDEWFRGAQGQHAMRCILSWQTDHGDWPKNTDTTSKPFTADDEKPNGTFDNGATIGELQALARAFKATGQNEYKSAFLKGFDHLLAAQYPNGGWPQYFPLSKKYHRHITFNDGTMIHIMQFLEETQSDPSYMFIGDQRQASTRTALDRGIQCILDCQVIVDGVRTVWCAQHHAETLTPVLARSYEHPSLSGAESAGVLLYLMTQNNPSPQVAEAIEAGVKWFDQSKILGFRYKKRKELPSLESDRDAPPLWARFYKIETNRPMFSDRDGVVVDDLDQIGEERRSGYSWYGNWGTKVSKAHAKWETRSDLP
ncbi:pectate lyase [Rhodopirellula sp. P2]|uniref:pectate lyase n=1 Tax=Rhodopirellula sp. P2 TaxID=2127060 RepID=UPI0023687100|nr:pectate lyase [Rhodopirellula sp. P2]WDQ15100.1 pectate lyase [Rhodopirellula sp. P2]